MDPSFVWHADLRERAKEWSDLRGMVARVWARKKPSAETQGIVAEVLSSPVWECNTPYGQLEEVLRLQDRLRVAAERARVFEQTEAAAVLDDLVVEVGEARASLEEEVRELTRALAAWREDRARRTARSLVPIAARTLMARDSTDNAGSHRWAFSAFEWASLLTPPTINIEQVGDAEERLHRLVREGAARAQIVGYTVSQLVYILARTVGYMVRQLLGRT